MAQLCFKPKSHSKLEFEIQVTKLRTHIQCFVQLHSTNYETISIKFDSLNAFQ
jgi:transposase